MYPDYREHKGVHLIQTTTFCASGLTKKEMKIQATQMAHFYPAEKSKQKNVETGYCKQNKNNSYCSS